MPQQTAAVAELEAGLIGQRTRAALAAAKARGRVLGGSRGTVLTTEARAAGVFEAINAMLLDMLVVVAHKSCDDRRRRKAQEECFEANSTPIMDMLARQMSWSQV